MTTNHSYVRYPIPVRENFSLKVEDIPGAQPKHALTSKKTEHYQTKLAEQKPTVQYTHHSNETSPFPIKKKYINYHHESEIAKYNIFKDVENPAPELATVHHLMFDYPRNLTTHDIPGALPGTLQSKVVKNYELAQKLRKTGSQDDEAEFRNKQRQSEDTLDQFKKEYQAKYAIKEFNNPYERMSDNYHFRSSHFGDYPVPDKRATLKQTDVKGIFLGHQIEKNNQIRGVSALNQKPNENHLKTEQHDYIENRNQNDNSKNENQELQLQPQYAESPELKNKYNQKDLQQEETANFEKNYQNFYRGYTPEAREPHTFVNNLTERGDIRSRSVDAEALVNTRDPSLQNNVRNFFGVVPSRNQERSLQNANQFFEAKRKSLGAQNDLGQFSGIAATNPTVQEQVSRTLEPRPANDYKKIYTYNIISNRPIPKVLPSKARIPYGYAISIDAGKIEALKKLEAERMNYGNPGFSNQRNPADVQTIDDHYYAGKSNDYGEINGRYFTSKRKQNFSKTVLSSRQPLLWNSWTEKSQ